ncbi:MAG TPA: DnaA regulatory inactivator Hda [Burkholderiales bacterium]|nr:DnaA regulatory inactivator Hda [Burkholderiales bacterium]
MKQLALALAPPPPPTLDNFVAGRNAELIGVLRALAARQPQERFVYLWGPAGCGKSHLLRAAQALLHATARTVVFAREEAELVALADRALPQALLVDDVQRLSDEGQRRLFHFYNGLRESGGVLLAAGDAPPAQLGMRPDLVTRLGWGLVFRVQALGDEEKAAALMEHAHGRGFELSREVAAFLLSRQRRDLPHLVALLDALDRYSLEHKRAITVPLVRELLAEAER